MLEILWTIGVILLTVVGGVFTLLGALGLHRFKDPYVRLQASSLGSTTAPFTYFLLALLLAEDWQSRLRVLIILLFFLVSSPTTTHIIGRYAWKSEGKIGR